MRSPSPVLVAALLAPLLVATESAALDLPFTKTALKNGLTVIVHEDHALPTVAVNIAYRVGARDEEVKRTGFAHLFEHLMFMGTKRVPTKQFDALMEATGGSNNAWTSEDVTDYHEVAPPNALPLLMWLEADRLDALGREIDQPKLDLQRDVVKNERRQSYENRPYGKVDLAIPELAFPDGHPYHHSVIGSHEDLEAAKVDDVRAFFAKFYVPSNASLVVAGDVKKEDVVALAEKYFGGIAAGTKPTRQADLPMVHLGKVVRQTIEDNVELGKIVMLFPSPASLKPGDAELDLLAAVLTSGKASRLYQALVYDKPLAQTVSAYQDSRDLAGAFTVEIVARPGVSLDDIEKAVDAVLTDAAKKAPTDAELTRAKSEYEHRFVSGLESMEARARLLNMYELKTGDPGFVEKDLARYRNAKAEDVRSFAEKTLNLGDRVIVRVTPKAAAAKAGGKP